MKSKEEILELKLQEYGIRKGWIKESKQAVLDAMGEYARQSLNTEQEESPQHEDDGKIYGNKMDVGGKHQHEIRQDIYNVVLNNGMVVITCADNIRDAVILGMAKAISRGCNSSISEIVNTHTGTRYTDISLGTLVAVINPTK